MTSKEISFTVEVYHTIDELNTDDAHLLQKARETTANAYAPYSNFHVGAAARLATGAIVTGSNQENASFPVGLCAERVLLSTIASLHPNVAVDTVAISYDNKNGTSNNPISPCGMCRQSLAEYETRGKQPMRIILSGLTGEIYVIAKAEHLLPLGFSATDLDA